MACRPLCGTCSGATGDDAGPDRRGPGPGRVGGTGSIGGSCGFAVGGRSGVTCATAGRRGTAAGAAVVSGVAKPGVATAGAGARRTFGAPAARPGAGASALLRAQPGQPLRKAALERAEMAFMKSANAKGRVLESFEILTLTGWKD